MAMTKSVLLVTLLVTITAASQVNAQLSGLGGITGGGGGLVGGLLNPLVGLVNVTGTVFCTLNGTLGSIEATTPVFPNAVVNLVCRGSVLGSGTTNSLGIFTIILPVQGILSGLLLPLESLLPTLLSPVCSLVVATPLSTCNPSLPAVGGFLTSPLSLLGALLGFFSFIPLGFNFLPI